MKRTFFKPGANLQKIDKRFASSAAYRSDGGPGDSDDDEDEDDDEEEEEDEDEEDEKTRLQKRSSSKKEIQLVDKMKNLATRAAKKEAKALEVRLSAGEMKKLLDPEKGAMKAIEKVGLEVRNLQQQIKKPEAQMSVRSQIKAWFEDNKTQIEAIAKSQPGQLGALTLRFDTRAVASPMLPANVMPGGTEYITSTEVSREVIDILRYENTMWSKLKKGRTSAETYVWINRKPVEGEAAFIAPGVYKPGVSFTIESEKSNAKKVAANEKMAVELLKDIKSFEDFVEETLYQAVMDKVNSIMFLSAGSSVLPKGISNYGTAYNLTTLKTTNPNTWDVVKAAITNLKSRKFRGPFLVGLNPIDYAEMTMTKAVSQGQLFIPTSLGAEVYEDYNIPQGKILAFDVNAYKIKIVEEFNISWGWENDDFTKNLVTAIGEMRMHQFVSDNHLGFAIYDDIATIKTALTPV